MQWNLGTAEWVVKKDRRGRGFVADGRKKGRRTSPGFVRWRRSLGDAEKVEGNALTGFPFGAAAQGAGHTGCAGWRSPAGKNRPHLVQTNRPTSGDNSIRHKVRLV